MRALWQTLASCFALGAHGTDRISSCNSQGAPAELCGDWWLLQTQVPKYEYEYKYEHDTEYEYEYRYGRGVALHAEVASCF